MKLMFKHLNFRITIDSKELSAVLWSRIKPYVHDIKIGDDPHSLHIHGPPSLMKGMWKPVGLNNVSKFCICCFVNY